MSSATTPLLGVVATGVIGRLGEAHLLGAVAMSSVVFDCLFWLFAFLRMGTVALTAQALGAGDVAEERATLFRALLVAGSIGLALILLQVPLAGGIYRMMGASAEVTRAAETYFSIRIWSAPFALANYVLLGWFVGLARANVALALQVVINLIDAVAIALLVLVFDLGVAGAALAAVIAEIIGTAAGLIVALRVVGARTTTGAPVRSRSLRAPVRDQPRHHDPHRRADHRVALLRRARRTLRRRRAGGEFGAAQSGAARRVLPRRLCIRRRAAVRPRGRRARRARLFARGAGCRSHGVSASASRRRWRSSRSARG